MTSANEHSQQRGNLKYDEYKMNRYDVSNSEGKFADGSDEEVLANKLGLSNVDDINDAELVLLENCIKSFLKNNSQLKNYRITYSALAPPMARNVYEWAGQLRTVNISKGGFMFAPGSSCKVTSSI